jgi:excisionase family DNA binding protein
MGSRFVTTQQAADLLGVSVRTIYRYTRKGILQTECRRRSLYIAEDDLRQLIKGRRDVLTAPLQRDIIAKLIVEVQDIKTKMATVMRLLNLRNEPLTMTLPEYELFYRAAEQFSIEGWSPHIEETWAENFSRLRVEDFEQMEKAVGDPHPWRPFLRLVTTMYLNPWNADLREILATGKSNVQSTAGIWCVLKDESPRTFDILVERDAAFLA